jgi:hypothetical protein
LTAMVGERLFCWRLFGVSPSAPHFLLKTRTASLLPWQADDRRVRSCSAGFPYAVPMLRGVPRFRNRGAVSPSAGSLRCLNPNQRVRTMRTMRTNKTLHEKQPSAARSAGPHSGGFSAATLAGSPARQARPISHPSRRAGVASSGRSRGSPGVLPDIFNARCPVVPARVPRRGPCMFQNAREAS